jgi:DNA-binding IclR family transcriptional regulator
MSSNQSNAAALRAFRVLEILAEADKPLVLADIVGRIELPKQTVHRILKQLESAWLVTRGTSGRSYECSSRVRQMAVNALMHSGLAAPRHAILQQLVDRIGETCNLTVLNGDDIVYLDRVETQWPLRVHLQPGSHVPPHCTSSGKLLLSLLPRFRRERLINSLPLRVQTANTITTLDGLRTELAQTRRRRIGVNNQEYLQGLISIAVPVMLDRNRACAAVAVQAPVGRATLESLLEFLPNLRQAAEEIGHTFKQ